MPEKPKISVPEEKLPTPTTKKEEAPPSKGILLNKKKKTTSCTGSCVV